MSNEELERLRQLLDTGQRLSDKNALLECKDDCRKLLQDRPQLKESWQILSLAEERLLNFCEARKSLEQFIALGGNKDKKILKRLASLKENEKKWNELILTPKEIQKLGKHLERELAKTPCDHSNRFSKLWLKDRNLDNQSQILEALQNHGGYCDCEVLANIVDDN